MTASRTDSDVVRDHDRQRVKKAFSGVMLMSLLNACGLPDYNGKSPSRFIGEGDATRLGKRFGN